MVSMARRRASGRAISSLLRTAGRAWLPAFAAALWLSSSGAGAAGAQTNFGAPPEHWLKIDWKVAGQPGRAVVWGHVYNDFGLAARDVSLLVEGLDASGRVVTRAVARVPFVVTPGTHGYFETVVAPAADYRVSVHSYTWMHDDDFRPFRRRF